MNPTLIYPPPPARPSSRPKTLFSNLEDPSSQLRPLVLVARSFASPNSTRLTMNPSASELTLVGSVNSSNEKHRPQSPSGVREPSVTPVKITKTIKFLTWFNHYRKILCLCLLINAIFLILALRDRQSYMRKHLSAMVLGNLLIGSMVRSEWVLRFLYWSSIMCFRWNWVPSKLKVWVVGVLYHIGRWISSFDALI